ncbi:MAG: DUF1549 domain-containing protein [Planctomycetaceae bacterium]|nr:DUF1549 domain-containing protein [Planctomycetaceae bacterium]
MWSTCLVCCLLLSGQVLLAADREVDFPQEVAPLLQRRCLACHNEADHKGDVSLQTAAGLRDYVVAGDPEASYLLDLVTAESAADRMPPEGAALSAKEVELLRRWIAAGANWPEGFRLSEPQVTDTDWWSLRPLQRPAVPAVPGVAHPVDRFIQAKLQAAGLASATRADRRTLIRRLSYDLLGLPPTAKEVHEFVNDESPDAYARLVDRYLASPHYGERWARHWLDVVHYGETHGYDKDKPRPNAWPYRDYVIRSLNNDLPYGRFIEQQLAGDVLTPNDPAGIEALGFIAAGPWDFIGHAEVPETKIDGQVARHLDRDDMVQNTITTFCGLTVGCAQCHHHKFDPITQQDYYALQAVFAALDRADRPYDRDPATAAQRRELAQRRTTLDTQSRQLEEQIGKLVGTALDDVDNKFAELREQQPHYPPEHGYHSQIVSQPDTVKWAQVDLGAKTPIRRVVLRACHDDYAGIGDGFGFPVRYRIEACDSENFASDVTVLADRTESDMPNPRLQPVKVDADVTARYIRVTATRLAERKDDFIFALAELQVWDADGNNIATGKAVTSFDTIEAAPRWRRQNLTDGIFPTSGYSEDQWAALEAERQRILKKLLPERLLKEPQEVADRIAVLKQQEESLPPQQLVYAGTIHTGQGAFRGTGHDGGKPRTIHVLHRGNVQQPGEEMGPGTLSCLANLPSRFNLPLDAPESARRQSLAKWISSRDNPLTWRCIVNRIWQYHFGRALAETPGDLGRMGAQPTHPELLDWLAVEFRDGGQSWKALHRLIVTSETYCQSSTHADLERVRELDAEHRLLSRFPARRLDAEALRDSMLAVSGLLDRTMGGPSFQDFVIEHPQHSPHYEYHLHNPRDPKSHRRSVYRWIVRSQTQPLMTVLDCADPSMQVDRRTVTISPLQALAQLNDSLTLVCAEALAAGSDVTSATSADSRLVALFQRVLQRDPTSDERTILLPVLQRDGAFEVARILLNLNEFAFLN